MLKYDILSNNEVRITGYNGNVTSINIPETIEGYPVTTIGIYAFENNFDLESITLPKTLTSIGDCAFEYCVKLKEIIIPENVTFIGSEAFKNCINLKSIVVSDKINKISNYAFEGCKNLKKISIPCTAVIGYDVFNECYSLCVDYYEPNKDDDEKEQQSYGR